MRSESWNNSNRKLSKEQRAFPVFRFRRGVQTKPGGYTSPFTEIPKEIKHGRISFGRLVRGSFNFLLLLILAVLLVVMVLAFAYQIVYHPEVLGIWATNLIADAEQMFLFLLEAIRRIVQSG